MSVKNQTDWPIQKFKKWAKPALKYPELIRIACTATSNTEAKNRALEFTKEQGLDEKMAMACRWLRILRTKLSEEEGGEEDFEKYLAENKPKKEKKDMGEKKGFELFIESRDARITNTGVVFNFDHCHRQSAAIEISYILEQVFENFDYFGEMKKEFQGALIQVVEKFGLKVKICGNCKYCEVMASDLISGKPVAWGCFEENVIFQRDLPRNVKFFDACNIDSWAPKEVSEK